MSSDKPVAKDVFLDAAELSAAERGAFLDQACAGQPELRERVEALLSAHDRSEDLPPAKILSEDLRAGDRVGPYELVEALGEGGFGVVWRALQEEPLRRYVAVKVLKLGMDTERVVRRFNTERQALALMDHPSIARVFDAGATSSGRPFFAMELVDGLPITDYCEQRRLGLNARLELFVAVCRAVQHAHQKGIIHRDLKPSNILVAEHDGVAVPKVIDFGIAKATGAGELQDSMLTAQDQFIGSPAYMSPEQMRAGSQDIDTRTDVYSLGVVLYEVLTATRPFELEETLEASSYHAVFERIRLHDPPRPSTHVTGLLQRDPALFEVSGATLMRLFRRDLDWIVMRALEKDRGRRYQTVGAFAQDVERFLEDEPVEATPPSLPYRLRKLARRHRVTVATASIVTIALLVGAAMALVGLLEARAQARLALERGNEALAQERLAREASERALAEKARAEEERDRANAVIGLLERLLHAPGVEAQRGPDYTVRALLDDFADEIGTELEDQPSVEASIRATIGSTYLLLQLPARARPHVVRARELKRDLYGEDQYQRWQAEIEYGRVLLQEGAHAEAEAVLREAVPKLAETGAPDLAVGLAYNEMAIALRGLGRYDEAVAWLERAIEGLAVDDVQGRATLMSNLGLLLVRRGDFDAAERTYREALALYDQHELDPIEYGKVLNNLGNLLIGLGRLDEAEPLLRASYELFERLTESGSYHHARASHNLGRLLNMTGRNEEAERLLRAAYEGAQEQLGPDHPDMASMINALGILYKDLGRPDDALEFSLEALALRRRLLGSDHPELGSLLFNVGSLLRDMGRIDEAREHLEEARRIVYLQDGGRPYRPRVHAELGLALEAQGDLPGAIDELARSYHAALAIDDSGDADAARFKLFEIAERCDDDLAAAEGLLDVGLVEAARPRARVARSAATSDEEELRARIVRGRLAAQSGELQEGEDRLLDLWDELERDGAAELRRRVARGLVELYEAWERSDERDAWGQRLAALGDG